MPSATSAPEGSAAREAAERQTPSLSPQGSTTSVESQASESEKLFGVNTESLGLVVFVVVMSLLLAIAALVVRSPVLLALIMVVALGATLFDVREITHQISESRNSVAALAVVTATLHVLVVAVCAFELLVQRRHPAQETA